MNLYQYITIFLILLLILVLVYKLYYLNRESFKNHLPLSSNLTPKNITNLKKGQHIMTAMMKNFDTLCKRNEIKYWAIGGTLIGALRHKGWIPWDGDIDIGMLQEDYDKFRKLAHTLPSDIEFSEPKDKPCSKLRSLKANYIYTKWGNNNDKDMGVQLDIFVYNKINDKIKGKISKSGWYAGICGTPDKNIRNYNDIFPLNELNFEQIKVFVPNKYKKISKDLWGGYPPKMIPVDKGTKIFLIITAPPILKI